MLVVDAYLARVLNKALKDSKRLTYEDFKSDCERIDRLNLPNSKAVKLHAIEMYYRHIENRCKHYICRLYNPDAALELLEQIDD